MAGFCRGRALRPVELVAVLLLVPRSSSAQLISPGKLAEAHAHLEGLTNCTKCHELGTRGVSDRKCLDCHDPLSVRITEQLGYHATVADRGCASCHKEHFGVDFDLVRFDSTGFDHAQAGYLLRGSHARLACRDCHQPDLITARDVLAVGGRHEALEATYLGLATRCGPCHAADDPHDTQFADRRCDACHGEERWEAVERFDHATTRYPLTGLHRKVPCEGCHRPLGPAGAARYADLEYRSCTSCHRDAHGGVMGTDCTSCHTTAGWQRVDQSVVASRFDHSKTDFPLEGSHAHVACEGCHGPRATWSDGIAIRFQPRSRGLAYPRPVADGCASCHVDYHAGELVGVPGGGTCDNCHGQDAWLPTTYDLARHNRETRYPLTGAHLATPCRDCHGSATLAAGLRFHLPSDDCLACHRDDDPHGEQFASYRCADCHATASFAAAEVDHQQTRFPLDGAHRDLSCSSCHPLAPDAAGTPSRVYRPLGTACRDCHSEVPR